MVTRLLLIEAAPTPWDLEGRLVGNRPLPLTAEGIDSIRHLIDGLPHPPTSIYRPAKNEACEQIARLIAEKFSLRMRDVPDLEPLHLGLWEGLTRDDVKFRFPTIYPGWLVNPLSVTPPDGEPLAGGITRVRDALKRILRRNKGGTVALPLRPRIAQIALGILHLELPEAIAAHLHQTNPLATIEIDAVELKTFIA
jgi:broad specificity phosphatase PhoE